VSHPDLDLWKFTHIGLDHLSRRFHIFFVINETEVWMKVGYARTSTVEQIAGLEAQEEELKASGVEKLFSERVSSVAKRERLEAALEFCRENDCLIVTRLDRLARSMADLLAITGRLAAKGVDLQILSMGLDTSTATGKLILNVMGAIAEFERAIMLERQRLGIAKAKAEGKFKGRAPTARRKAKDVIRLRSEGAKASEIAKKLEISRASVFRVLSRANPSPLDQDR
jgi:DNA invertase Pin-like site-specific DNA recombinase